MRLIAVTTLYSIPDFTPSGFERVRPEPALPGWTGKYLPRTGQDIKITFGPPIENTSLRSILEVSKEPAMEMMPSFRASSLAETSRKEMASHERDSVEERRKREAVTAVLQRAVEQLGCSVSGPLLGRPREENEGPKTFTPR